MNQPDAADACQGRARDREATRQRILDSARDLFTREGYAQVSSRRIAAEAGVNVALINRYFGAKRGLLAEVIAEDAAFPGLFEGDRATLPRRIADHVVNRTLGAGTPLQRALVHSSGDPDLQSVYQERLQSAIIGPLADYLGGPEAQARAALVASLLIGVASVRRMGGAEPLKAHEPEALTRRLTGVVERCLEE
ncbi:TetR/AcrR family transcriptional regulator [Streptomonospora litoralis]|uniref:Putative HTH-type transcriptional regulator YttP n=1 Tax=Streptomonospora litoralis TaxID=2498135 RepID=A0A4P6Q0N3_9ACTN|nr:TetR family transcriptional regulator [Streptomonospora litoralis]QBI52097.1 putative HTH-type transcriptional regulator YttP [Streptomonospora litoralis]